MATSFLEFFLCILMCSMICTQSRSVDIHQELTTISQNLIPCSNISTPTPTPSSTFLALSNQNLKGSLVHALFIISDSSVYRGTNYYLGTFACADHFNARTPVDVEDMIHGVKYASAGGDFNTDRQTSGSFSNARDYMAMRFGHLLAPSYLSQVATVEFMIHGVNYASAGGDFETTGSFSNARTPMGQTNRSLCVSCTNIGTLAACNPCPSAMRLGHLLAPSSLSQAATVEHMIRGVNYATAAAGTNLLCGSELVIKPCQQSLLSDRMKNQLSSVAPALSPTLIGTCICLAISYLFAGSVRETENSEVGPLENSEEVVGPRAENPVGLETHLIVVQNFLRPLPKRPSNYPMLYCFRDPNRPPVYAALVYCYHNPEDRVGVCDRCLEDHWYLRHGCNWAYVHNTVRDENRLLQPGFPWPGNCAVFYSFARNKSLGRRTIPTERVGYVVVLEQ